MSDISNHYVYVVHYCYLNLELLETMIGTVHQNLRSPRSHLSHLLSSLSVSWKEMVIIVVSGFICSLRSRSRCCDLVAAGVVLLSCRRDRATFVKNLFILAMVVPSIIQTFYVGDRSKEKGDLALSSLPCYSLKCSVVGGE